MGISESNYRGYRSLFWPIVLIGVGVVWLLGNLGVLTTSSLVVLARLWPLLLVVIGLDLLFGRRSPAVGTLIGIGAVTLAVLLMLVGPSLGLAGPQYEFRTTVLSEPRGDAAEASINLALSVADVTVNALADSPNLFEGDIRHLGDLDFSVTGTTSKTVQLRETNVQPTSFFTPDLGIFSSAFENRSEPRWVISLNPNVPMELNITGGVGHSVLDLSALQLTGLNLNTGVGEVRLNLPAAAEPYAASVNGGVGQTEITIADGAALTLSINGGVGETVVRVPAGAAVRLEARGGLGDINVPSSFTRTRGGDDRFGRSEGTWETEGFASASRRIEITYNDGVGGLTIR